MPRIGRHRPSIVCGALPLFLVTLLAACAGRQSPDLAPEQCVRRLLEPHPLWTAGAAWRPRADQLVLVDPDQGELLEFTSTGTFRRRVSAPEISGIEFAAPLRLQTTQDGYLLGSKRHLLWLDDELSVHRRLDPAEAMGTLEENQLNDHVLVGRGLFAYSDFTTDGEDWQRGFVRLDLKKSEQKVLHAFDLESSKEWGNYYFYDRRPYVATVGRRPYMLRFTEPPEVHLASRRGLVRIYAGSLEEGYEARSLYGHGDSVYLLTRRWVQEEGVAGLSLPELQQTGDQAALLETAKLAGLATYAWRLLRIDPRTGRRLAAFDLPAKTSGLILLPGEPAWGLIESPTAPNTGGDSATHLLRLPSSWLEAADGGIHQLICN